MTCPADSFCALGRVLLTCTALVTLLSPGGCSRHPCEQTRDVRPGWNAMERAPERPFLPAPAPGEGAASGCSSGTNSATHDLGCPRLLNGERPLVANLDLTRPPAPGSYRVYMLRSSNGTRWTDADPIPVAHSFSSLGLLITDDTLYLFGSSRIPVFTPYAVITALRTRDLTHWEGCAWNICREVNKGLVDTQPVVLDSGGIRMWYYSVPNPPGGQPFDPARLEGDHTLVFADLADGVFFARGVGIGGADLADPSVVRFRGRWYLAATQGPHRVILAESDTGLEFRSTGVRLEGVSVPFLTVEGQELWLVAQRYLDGTGPWPCLFTSRDGRNWQDQGVLVRGTPERGCTSPVLGRFLDQMVLFCATPEPTSGPAPLPAAPR